MNYGKDTEGWMCHFCHVTIHVCVIFETCYHVDSAQEISQSIEAEVEKRVTARLQSIASQVSALLVANIRQNASSSYSSSCTGGGYTVIQKHYDKLLGALTNMGMLGLTAMAYSRGLITSEVRDAVFSRKEANVFLSAIQQKIKTDPSAFDTFIEILRSEPAYEHLADMLQTSNFKT